MIPADLIERAHAVRIEDEIAWRGIKLRGQIDRCGPCPHAVAAIDSASTSENKFFSVVSATPVAMSSRFPFLDGCDFREAIEYLTGERAPAPSRPAPTAADAMRVERDERRAAHDLIFAKTLVLGMGRLLEAPEPVGYLRVERKIDTDAIADVL